MPSEAWESEDGEASSRATEGGFPLAQRDAAGGAKPGVVRASYCQVTLVTRHRKPKGHTRPLTFSALNLYRTV